jgi:predicted phosphodiesterase
MRSFRLLSLIFALCLGLQACAPHPWYRRDVRNWAADIPQTPDAPAFTLYLIGDCGNPSAKQTEPTLAMLKAKLADESSNSAVLFLGDNIYEYGLTAPDAPDRKEMERRMTAQLDATQDYSGNVYVIPGNHDWAQGKPQGLEARLREEQFVEDYLQRGNAFLPDNGCPGPYELELAPNIVLLAFDSQWWLHKHKKPGKADGCEAGTDEEFIADFKAALERNKDKKILVAAHHPLHSYGAHGGFYPPLYHLFPLLMASHKAYIPLPILGSIGVWYRKYIGSIQDLPNKRYKSLQRKLDALFVDYPGLIYISGHDHNLQYLRLGNQHYVVSGSGSKSTYVGHGNKALFTDAEKGISQLTFTQSGKTHLDFWIPNADGATAKRVFATEW